jgi:hypothetical protein
MQPEEVDGTEIIHAERGPEGAGDDEGPSMPHEGNDDPPDIVEGDQDTAEGDQDPEV